MGRQPKKTASRTDERYFSLQKLYYCQLDVNSLIIQSSSSSPSDCSLFFFFILFYFNFFVRIIIFIILLYIFQKFFFSTREKTPPVSSHADTPTLIFFSPAELFQIEFFFFFSFLLFGAKRLFGQRLSRFFLLKKKVKNK